jgi:hypothetical protein
MHIDALYTHDAAGDLVCVNEAAGRGAPAPRFYLGATPDGCVRRFRHDVTPALRAELAAASEDKKLADLATPIEPARYEDIISRYAPANKTWGGPAFTFATPLPVTLATTLVDDSTALLLEALLPAWIPDVATCQPMVVLVIDGKAVSICASVRITEEAHEAGVDTALAYRGRGYAAHVAARWANAVREIGRVPLYSTSWTNRASRSVARKLSLIHFGNDLHIT